MSYLAISIKDAISCINNSVNGWFLPAIQRPNVWGSRHENELYIAKLFDSILKGYPIGSLIIWKTNVEIPYREFVKDYLPGELPKLVEKSLHSRSDKWLIYDGQQRLQALYSCLKYTFNNKILVYDLLFDLKKVHDPDETGFSFVPKNSKIDWHYIRMNNLFSKMPDDDKRLFRKSVICMNQSIAENEEELVETNIDKLWHTFVKTHTKSLSYFPVMTDNRSIANEVFERLNIGWIALTEVELVLSKIKSEYFDFEEKLWNLSQKIKQITFGFHFSCHEILQVLYVLYFQTTNIAEARLKKSDYKEFNSLLSSASCVIEEFFRDFLWGQFKINSETLVCRKQALLPIIVYLNSLRTADKPFRLKKLSSKNLFKINQYFLFSQFCDWNTQTMVNKFSAESKTAGESGHEFPLKKIKEIAHEKFKSTSISYEQFISLPVFALKILAHDRAYQFIESTPQIDHIFPVALADQSEQYSEDIDVLWNYQPLPPCINNYKKARHPKEFFNSSEGRKFYSDYDFLPSLDSKTWDKYKLFLFHRQKQMRKHLFSRFGIKLKRLNAKPPGATEAGNV